MHQLTLCLLDQLESDAIHIIGEVAAEFEKPVDSFLEGLNS